MARFLCFTFQADHFRLYSAEEESKRTRGRLAAIIAASLAAGYFVYTSDRTCCAVLFVLISSGIF